MMRAVRPIIVAGNWKMNSTPADAGTLAAAMLSGLVTWCIVGHSERRRDQGETDALVGRKLVRCREHDLRPILCVGETPTGREAGRAETVVPSQPAGALSISDAVRRETSADWLVVAYEPVWAIGT